MTPYPHPELFITGMLLIIGFIPVMLGGLVISEFIPSRYVGGFLTVLRDVMTAQAIIAFTLIAISSVQF